MKRSRRPKSRLSLSAGQVAVLLLPFLGCSNVLGMDSFSFKAGVGGTASSNIATGGGGTGAAPGTAGDTSTGGEGFAGGAGATGGIGLGGAPAVGGAGYGPGEAIKNTNETVFIHTPERDCGGSLLTNQWVITASSCVTCGRQPQDIWVQWTQGYVETTRVAEIVRYPGVNCGDVKPEQAPDLMLLKLSKPFAVGESTFGYRRHPWPQTTNLLILDLMPSVTALFTFSCDGWYLTPGGSTSSPTFRSFTPSASSFTTDLTFEDHNLGDQIWVQNDNPGNPKDGRLFSSQDLGSPCRMSLGVWPFLASVYTSAAPYTEDSTFKPIEQARTTSLATKGARQFIDSTLFSITQYPDFSEGSAVAPLAVSRTATDYLWVNNSGTLSIRRREGETLGDAADLGAPGDVKFQIEQPGVLIHDATVQSVWVRDTNRMLWTRRRENSEWKSWVLLDLGLEDRVTPALLGGSVRLITRDSLNRGKFATPDLTKSVQTNWTNIPEDKSMDSHFTVGFSRVFARPWLTNTLRQYPWKDTGWDQLNIVPWGIDVRGEPAAVGWNDYCFDVFYRNSQGHLMHWWMFELSLEASDAIDTGITLPGTDLAATTSGPGAMEIVALDGTTLNVVRFPR